MIDCGAKIGKYTQLMARRGAHVFAFEPNPHAFAVLSKRFAKRANVTCFNKAVGAENGVRKLYLDSRSHEDPVRYATASSLLPFNPNVDLSNAVEVDVVDFVEFIVCLGGKVALVKMDIEGAEIEILERLLKTDTTGFQIGSMFVEMHDEKMPELGDRAAFIRSEINQRNLGWIDLRWH